MNHPYTCAASYIYVNESDSALNTHQRQYTPIDPRTKDPYGKQQSFVPVNRPYAFCVCEHSEFRVHRAPQSGHPPRPLAGRTTPAIRQTAPTRPPRRPTSTPRAHPIRAPHPAPRPNLKPITTKPRRRRLLLVGRDSRGTASASASQSPPPPPLDTPLNLATGTQPRCVPAPAPFPQNKYDDALPLADEGHPPASPLDVHTRLTPPMKMTPYERDGNPLSQRRSAFIPYNHGPPERKLRDSSGSIRCIRRALKQLKRLMSFKSLIRRGFEHA
ncbi:hypothetical protein B0H13DRAFT_1921929 [Mycena leptocephala]|nr:hypothetical protein B0H13DRAFT_1921929 [Mycena leptocephala]